MGRYRMLGPRPPTAEYLRGSIARTERSIAWSEEHGYTDAAEYERECLARLQAALAGDSYSPATTTAESSA